MAANFLQSTDLGSDTDDDDYVPDAKEVEGLSEEEGDGVDEDDGNKKAKKQKKNSKKGTFGQAQNVDEETEAKKREFEAEKKELQELEDQKKSEDLFAEFRKSASSASASRPPKKSGSGLGGMSFMKAKKGVKPGPKKTSAPAKSIVSSIFDDLSTKTESSGDTTESSAPNSNQTETSPDDKITITKVYDFAGENISVAETVDKDSKEAKRFLNDQEKKNEAQKRPGKGGLSSIMGAIGGKKTKMGCLDKSKLDWDKFVKEEGIKEELSTFNKGKDGYVEKQAFLERADLRRFEIERDAREKTRKSFNR